MILHSAAVTLGLSLLGGSALQAAEDKTRKVLFFSKSSGYEHSVIKRNGDELSFAEKILAEVGPKHGIEFTFSKDGGLFTPDKIKQFDGFCFYTTGDLTKPGNDKNPPMPPEGKQALLDAIRQGKGFIGTHSATDTFHSPESGEIAADRAHYHNDGRDTDPYIQMIGGEFISHNKQQKARMRVVDSEFPGMPKEDFELFEEWYSLKNIADDLHVLLVQETEGMEGHEYQRPPYPATWARMHGQGRVFYTSMGHREDVWTNPLFQQILLGGITWSIGKAGRDVSPDVDKVTPGFQTLPPK